jgi:hypothetical protein
MKAQNEDTTEVPVSLPACCHPSEGADLAEQLYCAYMRGGAPERAGLAWDGRPCPTWAELHERAAGNDAGARGVIAKWEAVVLAMAPKLVPPRLDLLGLVQRAIALDLMRLGLDDAESTALADLLDKAGGKPEPLGSLRLQRMLRAVKVQGESDA